MAKLARSKAKLNESSPETDQSGETPHVWPTSEEIAVRAYHIYLGRRGAEGDPLDDWLQAERELTQLYGGTTGATEQRRVGVDDQILGGEPIIKGTRTPVRAIVELVRLGVIPVLIPVHLPHLTSAQVLAALSYYDDHQEEINDHIERNRVPDEMISPLVKG